MALPFWLLSMKTVVDSGVQLSIFASDFCFVQSYTTVVLTDRAMEVETVNERITLDDKVLHITVVEVIPEEPFDSMAFQLSCSGNSFMCALGKEQGCFVLVYWFVVNVLDGFPGKSLCHEVNRNDEPLLISFQFIAITVQPRHFEADAVPIVGNIAVVMQIALDAAIIMFSDLIVQGILGQQETLRTTVHLVVGYKRNEETATGQSNKDWVIEDVHFLSFLSYVIKEANIL